MGQVAICSIAQIFVKIGIKKSGDLLKLQIAADFHPKRFPDVGR